MISTIPAMMRKSVFRVLGRKKGRTIQNTPSLLSRVIEQLEDRTVPAVFFVSTVGSDSNLGTASQPFRTIQAALDSAAAVNDGNDIVNVAGGVYATPGVDGQLSVPASANLNSLQLLGGWDAGFTTRNPSSTPTDYKFTTTPTYRYDVTVVNPNTTIDGFTWSSSNGTTLREADTILVQATGATISNNVINAGIRNGGGRPAGITTAQNVDVSGLQITNNSINVNYTGTVVSATAAFGIFLNPSTQAGTIVVSGNTVVGNNMNSALIISGVGHVTVQGNSITSTSPVFGNVIDLRTTVASVSDVALVDNTITHTVAGNVGAVGIAMNQDGNTVNTVSNVTIRGNKVSMGSNYALLAGSKTVVASTVIERNSFDSTLAGGSAISLAPGLDVSGNWLGSATATGVNSNISTSGSGTIVARSLLSSNVDASTAAGLQLPAATEMLVPQTSATTGLARVDGKIQTGVNTAAAGMIVRVAADTYTENVTVDRALSLLGPNAGIDPNTGVRGAEAILRPAAFGISNNASGQFLLSLDAPGIVVDGLLLDGDNTTHNSSNAVNGADPDVDYGITNNYATSQPDNLNAVVRNNIVQNINDFGIWLYSTGNGGARTNNTIANNRVDNILGAFGQGIRLSDNAFGNITDNVVTRVRQGVVVENFGNNQAANTTASVISGNTIEAMRRGVRFNNHYVYSAGGFTVQNNTIDSYVQGTPLPQGLSDRFIGVQIESVQQAVPVLVTGNTITGNRNSLLANGYTIVDGILVTNASTASPNIELATNSITGTLNGIHNETAAPVTLTGNAIADSTTGVRLQTGGRALFSGTNTITGGTTGLVVDGATAAILTNTLGTTSFTGQAGQYIVFANGALTGVEVNGITATFDGQTGAARTLAQNYALEDKITHATDTAGIGFVRVKAASLFVTPASGSVQRAVNVAATGDTVNVAAGTFIEDVTVGTAGVHLLGAGPGSSIISGAIGGSGTTVAIAASNVELAGFKITREGNSLTEWNLDLNLAGVAIQGQAITGASIHDNLITGNRNGIDVNNSNGHTIRNNVIDSNRTGIIFRNQTDDLTVVENAITNNFTVGVLFLDGSGNGTPIQSAGNSSFSNNNISGNWYGQIVDRQTGGALPVPGTTNLKNFSGNWFGTAAPAVTAANTTEPGYAGQIPVMFGGTATAPGGQPDIAGPASANFDITPLLTTGIDTDVETTPGRGTYGFQGSHATVNVLSTGAQTGATGRVQEGVNLVDSAGTVNTLAGTYTETVTVNKPLTLLGTNAGTAGSGVRGTESIIVAPSLGADLIRVTAPNVTIDGLTLDGDNSALATGVAVGGNTAEGRFGVTNLPASSVYLSSGGANANGLTVRNTIAQNLLGGVVLDGPFVTPQRGTVTANLIRHITANGAAPGVGVGTFDNFYADVTANTLDLTGATGNLVFGTWAQNNGNAVAGGAANLSSNTVTLGQNAVGFYFNNNFGTAQFVAAGNTVNAAVGVAPAVVGDVPTAFVVFSTLNSASVLLQSNIIGTSGGRMGNGVTLWNNPSNQVSITGGTIDRADYGISLASSSVYGPAASSTVAVSGVSLTGTVAGIRVEENGGAAAGDQLLTLQNVSITETGSGVGVSIVDPNAYDNFTSRVRFLGGNTINGGATGLFLTGAGAVVDGLTLGNTAFGSGITGQYVVLAGGALVGQEINGKSATFAGVTGAAGTTAENFTLEDKITHAVDNGSLGFVRVKAANVFVTPVSGSIQRGVDAATTGDTLNVASGTYTGNVNLGAGIDKAINLAAGASPGIVTINGNLTLTANDTLTVDIAGSGAGQYDQLNVNGTVSLGGSKLVLNSASIPLGTVFTLINNDNTDAVTGIFQGQIEGSTITASNGTIYMLSYAAGSKNNDVVLTRNSPPTNLTLTGNTVPENSGTNVFVGTFATTDSDVGDMFAYSFRTGTGDTNNSSFTIVGNKLYAASDFDFETKNSYSIRVRSTDTAGEFVARVFTINVTDENETPYNITSSPDPLNVNENSNVGTVVGTVTGFDFDTTAPNNTLTYGFADGMGGTDLISPDGLFAIDPTSGEITVNSASLNFESPLPPYQNYVRVTDGGGLFLELPFAIVINNVNEAPSNVATTGLSVAENSPTNTAVGTMTSVDPDTVPAFNTLVYSLLDNAGGRFQIDGTTGVVSVLNGSLLNYDDNTFHLITVQVTDGLNSNNSVFTVNVLNLNEAPTAIQLSGNTLPENAGVNALVGTLTTTDQDSPESFTYTLVSGGPDNGFFDIIGNQLVARGSFNFEDQNVFQVRIRSLDSGGLSFTQFFTITVTNLNEAPTDITATALTVAENAANTTVVGKATGIDPDTVAPFNTLAYSLPGDANGRFTINATTGIISVSDGSQLDFETATSHNITVQVFDGLNTYTKGFTVTVTNVNEAPYDITTTPLTVPENSANTTIVGTATGYDHDAGSTLSYSLPGNAGGRFTINATTGVITVANGGLLNFEVNPTHSITVQVTDGVFTYNETFTVNVTNVNEAPYDITTTPLTVPENSANGTLVGTATGVDPDSPTTFIYSLPGNAGGRFTINSSTGAITVANGALLNYEANTFHDIRVQVSDGSLTYFKDFTVNVTNVNEAPTFITLTPNSIPENAGANALVGTFTTTDPDGDVSFTYTFRSGLGDTDNGAFTIVNNQLFANSSFDFETKSTYSIRVRSTDPGNEFNVRILTINVTNVNEAPTNITATPLTVPENAINGTTVGTATGVDLDAGSVLNYSLLDNAGGRFAINSTTGVITVANGSLLNFEANPSHQILVQVTDAGGLSFSKFFTVTVTDVNEAPTNVVPGAQSVNEDTTLLFDGAKTIRVVDLEGSMATVQLTVSNGTLSVNLVGGATISAGTNGGSTLTLMGNQTQINAALSTLAYQGSPDFHGAVSLTVVSRDTDPVPQTDTDGVLITITPVQDIVNDTLFLNGINTVSANLITGTNGASADTFSNPGRTLTAVSTPSKGTVTFTANGKINYTPNFAFTGTDTFNYTVTSAGKTETGTVTIGSPNQSTFLTSSSTSGQPVRQYSVAGLGAPATATGLSFTLPGAARVAYGDVNGDGTEDIIVGTVNGSTSLVTIYNGKNAAFMNSFTPFVAGSVSGIFVAAGDANGDGKADITVSNGSIGTGANSNIRIYDGSYIASGKAVVSPSLGGTQLAQGRLRDIYGLSNATGSSAGNGTTFTANTGATVAMGDFNGDGLADIVVGTVNGGTSRVVIYDAKVLLVSNATTAWPKPNVDLTVYNAGNSTGVSVAAGDVNGDGRAELITGALSGGANVRVFTFAAGSKALPTSAHATFTNGSNVVTTTTLSGTAPTLSADFLVGAENAGVRVASRDLNNDGYAEILYTFASNQPGVASTYVGTVDGNGLRTAYASTPYQLQTAPPSGTAYTLITAAYSGVSTGAYIA